MITNPQLFSLESKSFGSKYVDKEVELMGVAFHLVCTMRKKARESAIPSLGRAQGGVSAPSFYA